MYPPAGRQRRTAVAGTRGRQDRATSRGEDLLAESHRPRVNRPVGHRTHCYPGAGLPDHLWSRSPAGGGPVGSRSGAAGTTSGCPARCRRRVGPAQQKSRFSGQGRAATCSLTPGDERWHWVDGSHRWECPDPACEVAPLSRFTSSCRGRRCRGTPPTPARRSCRRGGDRADAGEHIDSFAGFGAVVGLLSPAGLSVPDLAPMWEPTPAARGARVWRYLRPGVQSMPQPYARSSADWPPRM